MKKIILFLCLIALSGLALGYNQPDPDEVLENRVRTISHKLRCPTCQAMSVKESEAGLSNNMKAMIREMLVAGKGEPEILEFFVQRYGEWILREPPKTGFNLLLWTLPGILLVIALIGVIWWVKAKSAVIDPSTKALSSEEQAEIDKALKQISND